MQYTAPKPTSCFAQGTGEIHKRHSVIRRTAAKFELAVKLIPPSFGIFFPLVSDAKPVQAPIRIVVQAQEIKGQDNVLLLCPKLMESLPDKKEQHNPGQPKSKKTPKKGGAPKPDKPSKPNKSPTPGGASTAKYDSTHPYAGVRSNLLWFPNQRGQLHAAGYERLADSLLLELEKNHSFQRSDTVLILREFGKILKGMFKQGIGVPDEKTPIWKLDSLRVADCGPSSLFAFDVLRGFGYPAVLIPVESMYYSYSKNATGFEGHVVVKVGSHIMEAVTGLVYPAADLLDGYYRMAYSPFSTSADAQYLTLVSLGNYCVISGDTAKAVSSYEKAIELGPNVPFALYNLGLISEKLGETSFAFSLFNMVISIDPKFNNENAINHLLHLKSPGGKR